MKTRLLKTYLLAIGLFSASGVSGQKVITNHASADGYPVIDLSALVPMGCMLTAPEATARRTEINKQIPSNTAYLPVGAGVSAVNGTWNAKMSPLFQVMRADASPDYCGWITAYTFCKEYSGEGGAAGQWRLPTAHELQMIWVLYPQLTNKGQFTAFNDRIYYTCTEWTEEKVWATHPLSSQSGHIIKTFGSLVRCIRDLE